MSVEGRVVLVTGVTSGLGWGVAEELARRGMRVVGTGRRADLGGKLEDQVRSAGGDLTFVRADVRRVADCQASVDAAVAAYGRLDVLINNAGYEGEQPILDTHAYTEEQYDAVVDTNLKGAFFCARYALEHMVNRGGGGVIINIASINAVNGPARMAAYSASKAGLLQLTRTLADEYVLHGIRVNAVVLGGVNAGDTNARTQDAIARYVRGPDFVRSGPTAHAQLLDNKPEQIGAALALLCDDDAAAITGAAIPMDKAMTAGLMASTLIYMTAAEVWALPEG
jgi:NAD(P)-dependent dehydrogenase (short-subunit alcohol dehydrogenase family)